MQFTHLHVYCRDLEASLKFLTDGLKGKFIQRRPMMGTPGAEIEIGNVMIFLKEVDESWSDPAVTDKVCGYSHLGFFVEDLDKTVAELTAMPDVRLEGEPIIVKARNRRCAFLHGPGNLYVEVVEELKAKDMK